MAEILASTDDINAQLDGNVVVATEENTDLLQISAARIIRGNLSGAIDHVLLQSWRTPANTPELVREAAAKLIAAQHYFNEISKTESIIDKDHFAQKRYDEAMDIINGLVSGKYLITDMVVAQLGDMSELDFFPVDSTDRAFTLGMNL